MDPKDAEQMANSVDPDQAAPLGAVWSDSTLFAKNCHLYNICGTDRSVSKRLMMIIW